MQLSVLPATSDEDFIQKGAGFLSHEILEAIEVRGCCLLGLSGGSTPKGVYEELGKAKLPWEKVFLFLVDERFVRKDDPRSNQFLLRSTLLRHAAIPEGNIILPDTLLPLETCIELYTKQLRDLLVAPADLVVLGMGEDGHIASLFPPVDLGKTPLVLHTTTNLFDVHDRITVSFPCLISSKKHIFLIKGKKKIQSWHAMLNTDEDAGTWPAKAILREGRTTVIMQE